jgi:hypothetical protein
MDGLRHFGHHGPNFPELSVERGELRHTNPCQRYLHARYLDSPFPLYVMP